MRAEDAGSSVIHPITSMLDESRTARFLRRLRHGYRLVTQRGCAAFPHSRAFFFFGGRVVIGSAPECLLSCIVLLGVSPTLLFAGPMRRHLTPFSIAMEILLTVVNVCFLLRCACRDPGILRAYAEKGNQRAAAQRRYGEPVLLRGVPVPVRMCSECHRISRPRDFHCSFCEHCVEGFDHHCSFLGTCIGRRTYRDFYAFLVTLNVHALYVLGLCAAVVVEHPPDIPLVQHITSLDWIPIVLLCYVSLCIVFTLTLWMMHTILIWRNETTAENIMNTWVVDELDNGGGFVLQNPFTTSFCTHLLDQRFTRRVLQEGFPCKEGGDDRGGLPSLGNHTAWGDGMEGDVASSPCGAGGEGEGEGASEWEQSGALAPSDMDTVSLAWGGSKMLSLDGSHVTSSSRAPTESSVPHKDKESTLLEVVAATASPHDERKSVTDATTVRAAMPSRSSTVPSAGLNPHRSLSRDAVCSVGGGRVPILLPSLPIDTNHVPSHHQTGAEDGGATGFDGASVFTGIVPSSMRTYPHDLFGFVYQCENSLNNNNSTCNERKGGGAKDDDVEGKDPTSRYQWDTVTIPDTLPLTPTYSSGMPPWQLRHSHVEPSGSMSYSCSSHRSVSVEVSPRYTPCFGDHVLGVPPSTQASTPK